MRVSFSLPSTSSASAITSRTFVSSPFIWPRRQSSSTFTEAMVRPVLIIEDDSDIAESLKYNLEREGLSAVVALTGEQGLIEALNERNRPALIILDLMLPGMSGIELCR